MYKASGLSGMHIGRLVRVIRSLSGQHDEVLQGTLVAVRHRQIEDGTIETVLRLTAFGGRVTAVVPGDAEAWTLDAIG